jgi:hypothetical protein
MDLIEFHLSDYRVNQDLGVDSAVLEVDWACGDSMRSFLLVLCFISTNISAHSAPVPRPLTITGRVVAYSGAPACLNGNAYWSVLIRVEQPKNLASQLVRVDFSLPCDRSPEWILTKPTVRSFRLVRDKNADAPLLGCSQEKCDKNQSLPIWERPANGSDETLPFGQILPSYRSSDLPLAPVV